MKESGGASRFVILGMLSHTPLTGYQIYKWIEHEYSHFWQASFGQIYPTLKQLADAGLVKSAETAQSKNGRGQIVYSITDAGRKTLRVWLRKEPAVEKLRYEILLKISFGDQTESDVLLKQLDDFIDRNEAALTEMNDALAMFDRFAGQPEADHIYSRLTALCGQYHYSAMRDWALEAKQILSKKEVDLP